MNVDGWRPGAENAYHEEHGKSEGLLREYRAGERSDRPRWLRVAAKAWQQAEPVDQRE